MFSKLRQLFNNLAVMRIGTLLGLLAVMKLCRVPYWEIVGIVVWIVLTVVLTASMPRVVPTVTPRPPGNRRFVVKWKQLVTYNGKTDDLAFTAEVLVDSEDEAIEMAYEIAEASRLITSFGREAVRVLSAEEQFDEPTLASPK